MQARYYTAIIEGGAEPGYSVFFPDLPGCTSAGDTVQEAARNAEEALRGHIQLMIEEGEPLPDPAAPETIQVDDDIEEVARMLVRVDLPSKAVRINISIDEGLLGAIDRAASARGETRSGFLADAARRAIKEGA